jgi:serine/threonine protein kinase
MPIEHAEDHVEKRLSSRENREPEAVARLRSEAALLARLSATGVTPRLLASGEDGLGPWHRIERVRIPTLAERFARANGPLDPAWLERAVRASFGALASLHEAGDASGPLLVVHADLSPANIAVEDNASRAIVLDLDLAWWREGPVRNDGAFRGTIAYVAPEIARGERPTQQSDLFALAATLLHGVKGVAPRLGTRQGMGKAVPSFAALLAMAAEAPLLTEEDRLLLAAQGPAHAALLSCLAHDPTDRPPSARSVLAAITG